MFFHSRSRSREFLGMIASDSHSRIVGMDFFHSLPVPELWEWIFFIPFPFPNFGNRFFHSLPIPEFWECFFSFPSRSRIEGMGFFNSIPVPELWEWNCPFPFPFLNSKMSFPLTPGVTVGMKHVFSPIPQMALIIPGPQCPLLKLHWQWMERKLLINFLGGQRRRATLHSWAMMISLIIFLDLYISYLRYIGMLGWVHLGVILSDQPMSFYGK